ncbi:MAG TPA: hypothetical protein VN370_04570 [Desulfitobacteriaceae bacterium]|jgi:hypothetical protein|nr:hypothetical protein [Desulfitobacteriaceae bacterium]
MKTKRNKFLTIMFSLLPGAGHMFMGFMKMGLSMMSLFCFIIFLSSWLNIGPLLFILPILWFYSFFDCINKRYSSDEEFILLDDHFLYSIDKLIETNSIIFQKHRLFAGILLLFFGIYLLWSNIINNLYGHIPSHIYSMLINIKYLMPQTVLGIIIVVIGVRLIVGKKRENEDA